MSNLDDGDGDVDSDVDVYESVDLPDACWEVSCNSNAFGINFLMIQKIGGGSTPRA